jgi:hypothetical protein
VGRWEWILGKLAWGVWIGFDWLRTGSCECSDEPSGSCAMELVCEEPGSSVSIVSGYGLDDRGSIPGGGKRFFL